MGYTKPPPPYRRVQGTYQTPKVNKWYVAGKWFGIIYWGFRVCIVMRIGYTFNKYILGNP